MSPGEDDRAASRHGLQRMGEAELVEAARVGDTAAFDELVRRHMPLALGIASRVVQHREDAEDLVQESFVAALKRVDTFEPGRPFAPWLARIVINRGLNARKARSLRTTAPLSEDAASLAPSPLEAAEQSELRVQLRQALDELPEMRRRILELFEIDGFSSREIAGITGVAEGTVRWHLHHARATLRELLATHRKAAT
jgi:RNA polymerase sigma-70 factor, ECF subfamily